ncbi:MAG: Fuc2NAc and GlcNAc transferase [Gammaproteobacteria bacterium]|jgi:Fuc2NAc and GlcNAc transferase
MTSFAVIIFVTGLVLSFALTLLMLNYARKRNLVDIPNARSLHQTPVPRGGGGAILIATSLCSVFILLQFELTDAVFLAWIACGVALGLLGWLDDHRNLSSAPRFACQLAVAAVFTVVLSSAPGTTMPSYFTGYYLAYLLAATIGIVWMVNLYNFMDGADGYAASEALLVAGCGAVIVGSRCADLPSLLAWSVAGSAAGFLIWNWQPAKIFMGDVGSYFIGFQFAALVAYDTFRGPGPWVWLILLAPFTVDSSLTLISRILQRERWWQAHRSHVYQLVVLGGWSHARLVVSLWIVTLLVLAPAAALTVIEPEWAFVVTALVYALAAIIWTVIRNKLSRYRHSTTC